MIEKYLIERKDIVLKQIEKINLKIEHNSNVLEENTKKIKELEYIDDEAANIFSVKVRKEEFYKQKEASSLKEQSNSIKEQNKDFENAKDDAINEGRYRENITFQQLVDLYLFNANFRQIIFPEIEKIEINVRCRISNYFAEKYGVLGYLEADNFVNVKYHQEFLKDVHEEIRRNSKAPFVKNFRMNYAGGMLPIYALVEVFSFGTLSKFYKNMKNPDKKAIAKSFGIGYTYLESWLESISYVRNICAHYGRLYNAKLSKTPMLYKEYSEAGIGNNRIFGVLLCLKHILKNDNHWNMFVDKIEILFDKYENVDITTMGFKENWKALLENDK